ncbi:hypothetical protein QBC44DRAFT_30915 [Cladorrhinum sp. PSN332]|nr:hypothetical protein QBC44DRAFT_30915 [Cladorrhinum sp. PSN332]
MRRRKSGRKALETGLSPALLSSNGSLGRANICGCIVWLATARRCSHFLVDFPLPSPAPQLDPQSAFFRAKLATSDPDPASLEAVRLFIPHRRGRARSAYGYVAYAFVMVFGQRHIDLAA